MASCLPTSGNRGLMANAVAAVYPEVKSHSDKPIVIDANHVTPIEVEESLSLMDKEKEMIQRALKKHRQKRKDAARDLGISERTLYRKIKEYKIAE
jgi:transcriptional regulator with PAS, ATPase and Fis domain